MDGAAPKKHAIHEGIVKTKTHPLELSLHFRENILSMPTSEEIPQNLLLRVLEPPWMRAAGLRPVAKPPILVILSAFLSITQYAVCFTDLFEALFGASVPWITVRMRLQRKSSVNLLDLFRRSILRYSKDIVVVFVGHSI